MIECFYILLGPAEVIFRSISYTSTCTVETLVATLGEIAFKGDERWNECILFDLEQLEIDEPWRKEDDMKSQYQGRISGAAKIAADLLRVVLDKVSCSLCETLKQFGFNYASRMADYGQSIPLAKLRFTLYAALDNLWVKVMEGLE